MFGVALRNIAGEERLKPPPHLGAIPWHTVERTLLSIWGREGVSMRVSLPVALEVRAGRQATHSRWTLPSDTSLTPLSPGWVKVPKPNLESLDGGHPQAAPVRPRPQVLQHPGKQHQGEETVRWELLPLLPLRLLLWLEAPWLQQLTPTYLGPRL